MRREHDTIIEIKKNGMKERERKRERYTEREGHKEREGE